MNLILILSALVVFVVFLGFEYIILINRLVKKKEAISKEDDKVLEWIFLSERIEIVVQNIVSKFVAFVPTEFDSKTINKLDFKEKKQLILAQEESLKKVLDFSKKNLQLVQNDNFFQQEKKIRNHLQALDHLRTKRKEQVSIYNKSLKKSPVRSFSKMTLITNTL